uniref:Uncharacterized protein n=1 Tax=Aegilops tauschii subsp. strangulata TaxID=200361 RepID=A0A453DN96_AEGTS
MLCQCFTNLPDCEHQKKTTRQYNNSSKINYIPGALVSHGAFCCCCRNGRSFALPVLIGIVNGGHC